MLAQIAGKQEMIMQTQGLDNPLVGVPEYRNTLSRMLETANIADVSSLLQSPAARVPGAATTTDTARSVLILAQVQAGKTAADVENDRASRTDQAGADADR